MEKILRQIRAVNDLISAGYKFNEFKIKIDEVFTLGICCNTYGDGELRLFDKVGLQDRLFLSSKIAHKDDGGVAIIECVDDLIIKAVSKEYEESGRRIDMLKNVSKFFGDRNEDCG